jgi:hypothetical protein
MPLLKRANLAALLLCLPQMAGAATDTSSHWLRDPDTGCALFDASARPGDEARWSGACVEGRADGAGTARFINHGAEFESFTGSFKGGVAQDGDVKVSWGAGWSYEGAMVSGHFNGHGVLINDKQDRFEGDWKDGKLNGDGSVVHADGSRYEGEWQNDLPNGEGILTHADGSKQGGFFTDGKLIQTALLPGRLVPISLSASLPTSMSVEIERKSITEPPTSALNALSGKTLMAVDGATLDLMAIEGGIERDITSPAGKLEKTTFIFINDRLGTVAADGNPAQASSGVNVTGFFRLTDNGVEIRYADGRAETLSALADGVLLKQQAPGLADLCQAYFPEGHAFSDGEKKAAVAEYAIRLGLAPPETKTACPGDVALSAPPDSKAKLDHHAEATKPGQKFASANLKGRWGTLDAVTVKESVVHTIDAMPMPALPDAPR